MTGLNRRVAIGAMGVVLALTATACSSSKKGGGGGDNNKTGSASNTKAANNKAGGTLYYLTKRNVEHLDPQRMYIGRDLTDASRLFYRTLTQEKADNTLVPDLATTTGTASDSNRTWAFTLKSGPKWQDGTPITCEDVKYGVSRTFAVNTLTGGPNYALQFLDIGTDKNGSLYSGPYTKKNQALFDKAVVCTGNTITFHLKKPVGDFNYTVSGALAAFAPFKASQDKDGEKSNHAPNPEAKGSELAARETEFRERLSTVLTAGQLTLYERISDAHLARLRERNPALPLVESHQTKASPDQ